MTEMLQYEQWRIRKGAQEASGGARILEQAGPAAGPKVLW